MTHPTSNLFSARTLQDAERTKAAAFKILDALQESVERYGPRASMDALLTVFVGIYLEMHTEEEFKGLLRQLLDHLPEFAALVRGVKIQFSTTEPQ